MNNLLKVLPSRLPIALAICASLATVGATASEHEAEEASAVSSDSFSHAKVPVTFRNGKVHHRVVTNVNGIAMAEGDIIFGDADLFFQNSKLRGKRGLSNYVYGSVWPNGLVPFSISSDLSEAGSKKIRSAIQRWNETGAVTLVERTSSTAAAYPNYINFIDASQCASWVGFRNQGAQSIYAGDKCSEGSMIHEIGHALGLLHEHTRPDRDNHVQINWDSVTTDKSHNFDVLDDAILLGEYDYNSIMHYGTHFFSKNGQATITALQNTNANIGQREFISEGDEESVTELYATDLKVVSTSPSNTNANEAMEVELYVTNNTGMGANGLILKTAVPAGSKLDSFSSANWICQQTNVGENGVCQAPILAKSAGSSVSISLTSEQASGQLTFNTTLSSNTFDTNLSNNSDQSVTNLLANDVSTTQPAIAGTQPVEKAGTEPEIAAANNAPATTTQQASVSATATGGSSGGGAFGALGLLPFFYRRKTR